MIDKPEILSDGEINRAYTIGVKKYIETLPLDYDDYSDDKDGYKRHMRGERAIARAQRDKDVAFYEAHFEEEASEWARDNFWKEPS